MTDENRLSTYSTGDEMEYLNAIGTHGNFRPEQRRDLLEGYLHALKYRPRCGYLDMRRLRLMVEELLADGGGA